MWIAQKIIRKRQMTIYDDYLLPPSSPTVSASLKLNNKNSRPKNQQAFWLAVDKRWWSDLYPQKLHYILYTHFHWSNVFMCNFQTAATPLTRSICRTRSLWPRTRGRCAWRTARTDAWPASELIMALMWRVTRTGWSGQGCSVWPTRLCMVSVKCDGVVLECFLFGGGAGVVIATRAV